MTTDQILLFAIFGAVMALLFSGRFRHDLVAFAGLMAGVVVGVVPVDRAFSGFGHPATMVVALILVATAGLVRSGAVARLTQLLVDPERPVSLHVALMGAIGGAMSGFMNNIAALAILMPIDLQVARKAGRVAGLTLMPLAFATILGGMLTLIGTPPNLIVSGFRADVLGEPFRMFDFFPVGGAVALAGIAFVALVGWRLIPLRGSTEAAAEGARRTYETSQVLTADSTALGQTLTEVREAADEDDVVGLGFVRAGATVVGAGGEVGDDVVGADLTLAEGDVLVVQADPTSLDDFRSAYRLAYPDGRPTPRARTRDEGQSVIECLVPATARIRGTTARGMGLLAEDDTVLIGIRRRGAMVSGDLHRERLEAGDLLLLLAPEDRTDEMLDRTGVAPLDGGSHQVMREAKMALTVGIFVVAVLLTSFGLITMPIALGCVVVAYVLTKVLSVTEVYSHVDWSIVVLLASMIPLGLALDSTGGTALIAGFIVDVTAGAPAWVALLVLMVVTMFLSDLLNNNATTIVAAPVGIRLAEQLEVNPDAFLMGVAVAAACAFLTPIGHQNNTLVLGPGEYRFGDYWRMGLPLEIIVLAVAVPMLLVVWPL